MIKRVRPEAAEPVLPSRFAGRRRRPAASHLHLRPSVFICGHPAVFSHIENATVVIITD
jgi:hypothetical protein